MGKLAKVSFFYVYTFRGTPKNNFAFLLTLAKAML